MSRVESTNYGREWVYSKGGKEFLRIEILDNGFGEIKKTTSNCQISTVSMQGLSMSVCFDNTLFSMTKRLKELTLEKNENENDNKV
jgi:hypothetical protein